MKKIIAILFVFLSSQLFADDFRWDFINALVRNDFLTIENMLNENTNTMTGAERNLIMNFSLNFTFGENTVLVLNILERHNIRPGGFDLFTALNRNQPNIVIQAILNKGAAPNGEILLLVMERQRFDLAMQFIQSGVDVNYHYPLSRNYADGMTPLLYAVRWDNYELVRMLVGHGAEINVRDRDGSSALSMARANGNNQIYNFLVESGGTEMVSFNQPSPQSTGISSLLDSQAIAFQTGTYRLFGGDMEIRFTGNANTGSISYLRDGIPNNGSYRIEGRNLLLIAEGHTFTYRLDSNMSFSGNEEVWIRTGN
jgi:hypothetical protein